MRIRLIVILSIDLSIIYLNCSSVFYIQKVNYLFANRLTEYSSIEYC